MDNEEQGRMQLLEKLAAGKNGGNMWKVGESLGWDRQTTEDVATDLMGRGLLAIANLSGGVRVTDEGAAHLAQCSGAALQSGASEGLLNGWPRWRLWALWAPALRSRLILRPTWPP